MLPAASSSITRKARSRPGSPTMTRTSPSPSGVTRPRLLVVGSGAAGRRPGPGERLIEHRRGRPAEPHGGVAPGPASRAPSPVHSPPMQRPPITAPAPSATTSLRWSRVKLVTRLERAKRVEGADLDAGAAQVRARARAR